MATWLGTFLDPLYLGLNSPLGPVILEGETGSGGIAVSIQIAGYEAFKKTVGFGYDTIKRIESFNDSARRNFVGDRLQVGLRDLEDEILRKGVGTGMEFARNYQLQRQWRTQYNEVGTRTLGFATASDFIRSDNYSNRFKLPEVRPGRGGVEPKPKPQLQYTIEVEDDDKPKARRSVCLEED